MKIVGIITARGGSKGIPNKNIRIVNKKPLIHWTFKAAINSIFLDAIYITTEDPKIKKIGKKYSIEVIDRPDYLSSDEALHKNVILHALDIIGERKTFDAFMLLQPTSPLRSSQHIDESIRKYMSGTYSSCVSISKTKHSPYKSYALKNNQIVPLFSERYLNLPRQQLPITYRPNGAIFIVNIEKFKNKESFNILPICFYEMDEIDSIDVDKEIDLIVCEYLCLVD